jgi:urease accessory protein
MDVETEEYILLLLSDGNLPTGSFVASSGLESYVKHGFFASSVTSSVGSTEKTMDFVRYSLESYSHSALPFVMDAHVAVSGVLDAWKGHGVQTFEGCREKIIQLDALYDAMTLNHVARRASKAQGVALLTLFSKGFSRPTWLASGDSDDDKRWSTISSFVDRLKLDIRRSATHGHLPVCWGVLTAALHLSAG